MTRGDGDGADQGRFARLCGQPELLAYLAMRACNLLGAHMFNVVLGWQIYELTSSALMLGVAGMVRFVPAIVCFPLAGYASDRYPRLRVFRIAVTVQIAALLGFLMNALAASPSATLILALLLPLGISRAFLNTAARSILPGIISRDFLPNALAYNSTISKAAAVTGPVLGGLLIGLWGGGAYAAVALAHAAALAVMLPIRPIGAANSRSPDITRSLLAGLAFIRERGVLLSAISLDFTVVVSGTVLGILPVFAKDVLDVGPEGLGLLRAMPPMGAMLVALLLGFLAPSRSAGMLMFAALFVHGFAIIGFALSTTLFLSLAMLLFYGASDMICVILRQSLIQLATPDEMRGRVSAIDSAGSNGSEELGNFRSGVMALALGAQPAVVMGGIMAIALTAIWAAASPNLRQLGNLSHIR